MTSPMLFFIKSLAPWIAAIATLVTFASFFFYLVLALFFTCLLLILSTSILFTLSNKSSVQNNDVISSEVNNIQEVEVEVEVEVEEVSAIQPQTNTMSLHNKQESPEENGVHQILRPTNLYLESETIDQFSEDSDLDSPSGGVYPRSPEFSDGSISDEESLIEIALPSGQYVSPKLSHKLPCFSAEAMFKQHGLMELLAEFNEEENLIEIDISMGSIKYSRFEIKA